MAFQKAFKEAFKPGTRRPSVSRYRDVTSTWCRAARPLRGTFPKGFSMLFAWLSWFYMGLKGVYFMRVCHEDNHLLLIDLRSKGINGSKAEAVCEQASIVLNKRLGATLASPQGLILDMSWALKGDSITFSPSLKMFYIVLPS